MNAFPQRLPPYGRKLVEMRSRGFAPSLAILIKDGWASAAIEHEHSPWVVAIPDGEAIETLDFRFVAGLCAYVVGNDQERTDDIAAHLFRYCPSLVCGWTANRDVFTIYARAAV
jgi:hypothetical protein